MTINQIDPKWLQPLIETGMTVINASQVQGAVRTQGFDPLGRQTPECVLHEITLLETHGEVPAPETVIATGGGFWSDADHYTAKKMAKLIERLAGQDIKPCFVPQPESILVPIWLTQDAFHGYEVMCQRPESKPYEGVIIRLLAGEIAFIWDDKPKEV